jgi:hypothetical protein
MPHFQSMIAECAWIAFCSFVSAPNSMSKRALAKSKQELRKTMLICKVSMDSAHACHPFQMSEIEFRTRWISEGSMACLLGVLSGIFLLIWDVFHSNYVHKSLSFDSAAFFTYMLPPIIFYGGLAIKRTLFVSNLLSILAFGVLGTFISFTLLGVTLYSLALLPNVLTVSDCFSLAAIFAATDSVAVLQACSSPLPSHRCAALSWLPHPTLAPVSWIRPSHWVRRRSIERSTSYVPF